MIKFLLIVILLFVAQGCNEDHLQTYDDSYGYISNFCTVLRSEVRYAASATSIVAAVQVDARISYDFREFHYPEQVVQKLDEAIHIWNGYLHSVTTFTNGAAIPIWRRVLIDNQTIHTGLFKNRICTTCKVIFDKEIRRNIDNLEYNFGDSITIYSTWRKADAIRTYLKFATGPIDYVFYDDACKKGFFAFPENGSNICLYNEKTGECE